MTINHYCFILSYLYRLLEEDLGLMHHFHSRWLNESFTELYKNSDLAIFVVICWTVL